MIWTNKLTNVVCVKHGRSGSQGAGVQEYTAGGADQKSEDRQQG